MALYRNPGMVSDSHEDPQGPESLTQTSPEELKAFYEDMERVEILERKLSKRESNSGTSTWSRNSVKRSTTAPPAHLNPPDFSRVPSNPIMAESDIPRKSTQSFESPERSDAPRLAPSRSVISGTRANTNWAEDGPWVGVPRPTLKVNYPLHNPLGPRWYKNHHLIPPSQKRPSMRPPTFFSPSFPPMHTSSSPEHIDDSAGPSKDASHSPFPTPTSSQTRVGEVGKPRSRKTSQTAPDNVDLLDVTDPWGTNWHHQSPYDIGQTTTVAADVNEISSRPRRASMTTTQSRHKSVTPSPLSQSTSAIHLQAVQPEIQLPRKLSKRRTQTAPSSSDHQTSEKNRRAASAPATPVDHVLIAPSSEILPLDSTTLPKRMSVAPAPVASSLHPTPKKEKRGSMLDRLVQKFSLLKRSTAELDPTHEWWHHVDFRNPKGSEGFGVSGGQSSSSKSRRDSVRRVPPPPVEDVDQATRSLTAPPEISAETADKISLASVESPYSMGRLTVANPDLPEAEPSATEIQTAEAAPLPPEKPKEIIMIPNQEPPMTQRNSHPLRNTQRGLSDRAIRLDKPLPSPQLATPESSQLRLSDVQAAQAVEEALKLPSPVKFSQETTQKSEQSLTEPRKILFSSQEHQAQNVQEGNKDESDLSTHNRTQAVSSPNSSLSGIEKPKRTDSQVEVVNPSLEQTLSSADPEGVNKPSISAHHSQIESSQKVTAHSQTSKSKGSSSLSTARKLNLDNVVNGQSSSAVYRSHDVRDSSAEASTSKRESAKLYQSHSRAESASVSAPVKIPFPSTTEYVSHSIGARERDIKEYERSPLSVSSTIANPPTPYDHRLSIAMSDAPTLPPKGSDEDKSPSRRSPADPSPSRQTETFKLVRSLSGHVYASSETIMAAGQQWEVVESVEIKGKKEKLSSRYKEQARNSRELDRRPKDHDRMVRESQRKSDNHGPRLRDDRRSRDYDRETRDEYRPRDYERSSRNYNQRKAKDSERAVKEYEGKYVERSREEQKVERRYKDNHRSRDRERVPEELGIGPGNEQEARDSDWASRYYKQRSKEEQRAADHGSKLKNDVPKLRDERNSRNQRHPQAREQDPRNYDRRSHHYERPTRVDEPRSRNDDGVYRGETKRGSKLKSDVEDTFSHSSRKSSKRPAQSQDEYGKRKLNGELSAHHEEGRRREEKSGRNRDNLERQHNALDSDSLSNHAGSINDAHPQGNVDPVPVTSPPTLRLERNPSITARPTSELPSAAEMNAIRAKESWEIERLWKARSMYGLETNEITHSVIPDSSSSSSGSDDAPSRSAVYGSKHTAYVVQTPFQAGGHQIYHSMPTAPPPVIYSSPASIPSIPDSISTYEPYEQVHRSFPAAPLDYRLPPVSRPLLSNPLPEPPREASLELKGLKMTVSSNHHSNDSWTKYNGITTSH